MLKYVKEINMSSYKWFDCKEAEATVRYFAPRPFLEANGFTRISSYNREENIEKILKSGTFASTGYRSSIGSENIPYIDHALLYKNPRTKTCCLVYVPYQNADEIRNEIQKWAESRNLKATIMQESWYRDNTCTVIISPADKHIIVDSDMFKKQ